MNQRRKLTKDERMAVYRKTNGRCAYCGCVLEYKDMQVDHIIPINGWSEQGEDTMDNMLPACRSCNAVRFGLVTPTPHPVKFYFEQIGR